jgi:hypothetical protein
VRPHPIDPNTISCPVSRSLIEQPGLYWAVHRRTDEERRSSAWSVHTIRVAPRRRTSGLGVNAHHVRCPLISNHHHRDFPTPFGRARGGECPKSTAPRRTIGFAFGEKRNQSTSELNIPKYWVLGCQTSRFLTPSTKITLFTSPSSFALGAGITNSILPNYQVVGSHSQTHALRIHLHHNQWWLHDHSLPDSLPAYFPNLHCFAIDHDSINRPSPSATMKTGVFIIPKR